MNIREAILAAADHIEANPGEFDFDIGIVPVGPGRGLPACPLAWIGTFFGSDEYTFDGVARSVLGLHSEHRKFPSGRVFRESYGPDVTFYNRMGDICGSHEWKESAPACAKALRLYADRYHPADEVSPEVTAELNRILARVPA